MAALAPAAGAVADPPLIVDGEEKTIPPGSYETIADSLVGLRVRNGGEAIGTDVNITTYGRNSYAVELSQPYSLASLTNGTLHTKGSSAYAIQVRDGGLILLENVTIMTEGGSGMGARINGPGSQGKFSRSHIETSGYGASGLIAESEGGISLDAQTEVVTRGDAATALLISGGASLAANTADIKTTGAESHGLHVDGGSTATLAKTSITTSGRDAHAINADRSSGFITVGESRLVTESDRSLGINVQNGSRVAVRNSHIETLGEEAPGVFDRAALVSLHDVDVITHGSRSYGITAKGGDYAGLIPQLDMEKARILTHGGSAYGVVASTGGRVDVLDSRITTNGVGAHGLLSAAGVANVRNTDIETTGSAAYGIDVQYGGRLAFDGGSVRSAQSAALRLNDPGTVRFGRGAILQGGNGAFAEVDARSSQAFTIALEDQAYAVGDIRLAPQPGAPIPDETKLSLSLRGEAIWSGASSIVRDLSLESGGTWVVTGDSHIRSLRNDHGVVAFAPATSGAFGTLTIAGDYEGNEGLFRMRGRLGDDSSPADRIHVMGNTSGNSLIAVDALDGAGADTVDGIQLVRVDGRSEGTFALSGRAVAGAHEYFLHKGSLSQPADGGWYLRSSVDDSMLEPEDGESPTGPVDPIVPPSPVLRPETGTYRANQMAALDMFQAGPGGGRDDEPDSSRGSAWARFERRHTAFDLGNQVTTTTSTSELTIGADLLQGSGEADTQLGVMAAMGQADTRGTSLLTRYSAKGRVKGAAGGIYGGLRTAAGTYLRGWMQYAHFNQRVEGDALAGERYGSGTLTTSLETGHRWRKTLNRDTDVYLEPQAQLIAARLRGGTHTEANGTRVSPMHASGSTARLGMRTAARWHTPRGHVASPYFAANWLRRLGRLDATQFNAASFADGVPRNAYALKLGLSMLRNDGWHLWGDVETRFGVHRYRRVAGTLGIRKNW